ncbi:MAG: ATP-binding cassette domain-containing protein [Cyclobacteriaceae bacterium]
MSLLKAENISKAYSDHQALSDVSLEIPEKSIFGLLGPNGAGKTTLIRIITMIIEQDQGQVTLKGQRMNTELVRRIGYLPEERGLYKKMKVGEQLKYLAQLKGLSRQEATKRIKNWLEKLELSDWWNKSIEDLSKGMAQKVQFIATVLHEPDLLILDEPFSGFDPVNADIIKNEILELRDKGSTIIFSTHRMESVEELCDHIALINKSKKILDGKKLDIKEQFRDGTFMIEYTGKLEPNGAYELINSDTTERGLTQSIVKTSLKDPNELLKALISKVEIHSFVERVPSVNEIFISQVKGENHE